MNGDQVGYEEMARKRKFRQFVIVSVIAVIGMFALIYLLLLGIDAKRQENLGKQAVMALYNYNSLAEFDSNIAKFEKLVTPEVFSRMTANNTDRILSVYLKFRAKPCQVNIIESSHNYIVYSLISESIEPERLFLFAFSVFNGKISNIKEAELFVFSTTVGWSVDFEKLPEISKDFEAIPDAVVPRIESD